MFSSTSIFPVFTPDTNVKTPNLSTFIRDLKYSLQITERAVEIHLEYAKQFQLALSGKTDGISQEVRRLNTTTTVSSMSWCWRLRNKVNMLHIKLCRRHKVSALPLRTFIWQQHGPGRFSSRLVTKATRMLHLQLWPRIRVNPALNTELYW